MSRIGTDGPVVVVGAGLAGSMLATYLARQGHDVQVYESRPDLRRVEGDGGRSINLALATRGLVPLAELGLADAVDEITVPMAGRMIHADGAETFQRYGNRPDEVIHSVSRRDLTALLIDAAEATGRVGFAFDRWCHRVDLDRRQLVLSPYGEEQNSSEVPFGTVFGCDGSGSEIREDVTKANGGRVTTDRLAHGYKELTVPPADDGGFRLDPNALHIWPRGDFMLIALANPGGDFTATLFLQHEGPDRGFSQLTDVAGVERFFAEHFDDFAPLVPDLAEQFLANPTGSLATVRVDRWSVDRRAVLVGDAAHAIVPFHGQGMNLAMESCRLLDQAMRAQPDDPAAAFAAFEADRKADADAIADMAIDNYEEMRSDVIDPDYLLKRELALALERRHPDLVVPRYGMVMFTTMPYAQVQARAAQQQDLFSELTAGVTTLGEVDLDLADRRIAALGPLPEWR